MSELEIIPADPTLIRGALAAALANAQAAFPAITRDKDVTVQLKSGGSYKFKYAPLDSILNAVRKPLADNGLAITQLLDDGDLVTSLMHKDGGIVSGRITLPDTADTVQALGSAITYLRRYSIQAILGIAAEEDDDGNQASGNTATFGKQEPLTPASVNAAERERLATSDARARPGAERMTNGDGSLIGTVELAKDSPDFLPHVGPEGAVLTFKLTSTAGGIKVIAKGPLAEVLSLSKDSVVGQRVSCWGRVRDETFTKPARGNAKAFTSTYQVLDLERIKGPDFILPAPEDVGPEPPDDVPLLGEQETAPLFDGIEL